MTDHERLVEAVRSEIDEGDIAIAGDTEYLVMLAGGEIHSKHPTFGLAEDALEEIRAQRILAAVARELAGMGWVCVPREATREMLVAPGKRWGELADIWTAMLTAAPCSPLEAQEGASDVSPDPATPDGA